MNINNAVFEAAFGTVEQLIPSNMPEYCFSGRSNVGKSSLINRLLGRKSLARVSGTPGKTVTVNFYRAGDVRLVDLPGYGYARNPSERERWSELMEGYFRSGRDIRLVFQLVDARRPATPDDVQMLEFLNYMNIPYVIVLTKCDKLNKTELKTRLEAFPKELGTLAENTVLMPFSALKGTGCDRLRELIEKNAMLQNNS